MFAVSDTVLLHMWFHLRKRGMTVPRNSLTRYTARHLRIRRLVQFIFVGAVYHNALTNCAALLCRACEDFPVCVAVRKQLERLRSRNGRTLCAPTEDEQYARSLASLSYANFAVLSQKETGFIRVETLVSTLMPLAVGTAPLPGRQDSLAS